MTSGFRKKSIVQKTHRCERKCQATHFGVAAIIGMVGLTNISESSCGNYSGGSMKFVFSGGKNRAGRIVCVMRPAFVSQGHWGDS
jgi:hypothetical protein